jgi:hypothetical protein
MPKIKILRGVVACGEEQKPGAVVEVSAHDANMLIAAGDAELHGKHPAAADGEDEVTHRDPKAKGR